MNKFVLSALTSGVLLGAAALCQAQVSSFNFVPTSTAAITYTPGPPADVSTATSITVPMPYDTNGTGTGFFSALPSGKPVVVDNTTYATGSITDFTLVYAGDTFTFTGTPGLLGPGTSNGLTATNSWTEFGSLTDTKGFITTPGGALGQLSLSAIQNLSPFSASPNVSFTFTSQALPGPPPTTPEPGDVAMIMAFGLSGLSFMVRRRNK